jgi:hypothetical protein
MKRWLFLILCLFAVSGADAQMTAYQDLLEGNKDYAAKDYQNALVNYQAAAAANANYGVAFQGVGNCQLILGNKAAALAAYQTSLSLKPDNAVVAAEVQKLQAELGTAPTAPPPPAQPSTQPAIPPDAAVTTPAAGVTAQAAAPADTSAAPPALPTPATTSVVAVSTDNSPLPKEGSIAWNLGLAGWLGGSQDLQDFYGPALTSSQTTYGYELDLGADYTLARSFQLGLQAQGMAKSPETVTDDIGDSYVWTSYAVGGAVVAKYLIPIQDKWNLIFHVEGGYYTLVGSTYAISGFNEGNLDIDASNFGGMFAVEGEFLQGANKSWALDIGIGYRYLQMTPLTYTGTFNGASVNGTFKNNDSSTAYIDFSGLRLNGTLRFY